MSRRREPLSAFTGMLSAIDRIHCPPSNGMPVRYQRNPHSDISTDEDFRSELRRLSASFGIGIIELDIEDADSSQVLVPARERDALDWDALNKVAMNKDVQDLMKRISNDLQTNEIRTEEYDKILSPEELLTSIRLNNR